MIINGKSLLQAAPIKDMVAEKLPAPGGVTYGLGEAGYDIRLKQGLYFCPAGSHELAQVGVNRDGGFVPIMGKISPYDHIVTFDENYHQVKITEGRFILGSTVEEFDMPNGLVGIVHDKSTWARQGLSVFNTVIEPGWKGFLTLELAFKGRKGRFLPRGTGIAQVIFHQTSDSARYTGRYQNQEDNPVESKWV